MPKQRKLYVLVRGDLPASYQAVQAGHALAEFLIKNPETDWRNNTLVYLNVEDEEHLKMWCEKLDWKGIEWTSFREPDIGNEMTAIACLCDSRPFSNLRLMGNSS